MWLIETRTHELKFFHNETEVPYAILSHRWEEQEVSHNEILERPRCFLEALSKSWDKIVRCCQQAEKDNIHYVWVDFCCIDKSSSAELQEAINSMFRWYRQAAVCYALLSDVENDRQDTVWTDEEESRVTCLQEFRASEWFRRGWTLQELIAPTNLVFFDRYWRPIGNRCELASLISEVTGVTETILQHGYTNQPCVADIMSWAAGRETTRIEDRAYSLLGLFGINMPLLYGEGDHAFIRLQEEILRRNDDQSIFAWSAVTNVARESIHPGLFATSPDQFSALPSSHFYVSPSTFPRRATHAITNEGISLQLQLVPVRPRIYLAVLNPLISKSSDLDEDKTVPNVDPSETRALILLKRIDDTRPFELSKFRKSYLRQVTVVNLLKDYEREALLVDRFPEFGTQTKAIETGNSSIGTKLCAGPTPSSSASTPVTDTLWGQEDWISFYPDGQNDRHLTIRLQSVVLKFDSDFIPVCTLTQKWLRVIARGSSTCERSEYTSDPYPHTPELMLYLDGGEWSRWSDLNRDVVEVRPTIENFFSGEGFTVNGGTACDEQIKWGFSIRVYESKPGGKWHAEVTTYLLDPAII